MCPKYCLLSMDSILSMNWLPCSLYTEATISPKEAKEMIDIIVLYNVLVNVCIVRVVYLCNVYVCICNG